MDLLRERSDLEVCVHTTIPILVAPEVYKIVTWPEDRECDRSWLLENVKGAVAAIVMLTDKVRPFSQA
jgi:hypothetical protein